ncbi:cupin domain-containing protein [Asaia bogorensis]|uniref:cupin domain-containing protein n=1 Tax=Asaia bogorensis TaxID=91915 RepID=UPI0028567FF8|nr:cupin domain-containing protein [Asaia bogorensis]MDR6183070.1 oxalate decarboxylase/phosphoglucose isomerase-like protein (cupin superfamily) [Asaia bogorensis NBRC 16594]
MASFDHNVFQRLLGAVPTGTPGFFSARRSTGGWAMRSRTRRSDQSLTTAQEEGWSWSERVAPFGIRDVRVNHHVLGASIDGAATACPASGWGMVVAGCATLSMRPHASASIRSMILNEGDVWSVPASASAWFHCHQGEQASVVAFVGGREPEAGRDAMPDLSGQPLSHAGFHHNLMAQEAERTCWGSLRVVEADVFCDPDALSAALVEIEPDCRTDLHWHLNTSVWQICLDGEGQLTRLPKGRRQHNATLRPGVMAYVPRGEGYFVRNDGDCPVRLLEIFRSDHYHDLSLPQWLAASSAEDIAAHLCVDVGVVASLARRENASSGRIVAFPARSGTH